MVLVYFSVRKKFGCIVPREPVYGTFRFRRGDKSLKIVCEPGFIVVGTPEKIHCRRGKWNSYLFEKPFKMLDFRDNCTEPFGSKFEGIKTFAKKLQ